MIVPPRSFAAFWYRRGLKKLRKQSDCKDLASVYFVVAPELAANDKRFAHRLKTINNGKRDTVKLRPSENKLCSDVPPSLRAGRAGCVLSSPLLTQSKINPRGLALSIFDSEAAR